MQQPKPSPPSQPSTVSTPMKQPRKRLLKANVQEIIQEKDAVTYDGQVAPHYLTRFIDMGVLRQEWLEKKELPVKMLQEFNLRSICG